MCNCAFFRYFLQSAMLPPYINEDKKTSFFAKRPLFSENPRTSFGMTRKILFSQLISFFFIGMVFGQEMQWTWMGNRSTGQETRPVYGQKGIPDLGNSPGNITQSVSWTDEEGDFWTYSMGWVFGPQYPRNVVWKLEDEKWVWVAGDPKGDGKPVQGTKGVPGAMNTPGERPGASTYYHNGILYLFGGRTFADNDYFMSDLWQWDGEEWTYITGPVDGKIAGVWGIKGVGAPENQPEGRQGATCWVDDNGDFWVFGGGSDQGTLNDLWKWDGTYWTWMHGADSFYGRGVYPKKGVVDPNAVPGSRTFPVAWTDTTGSVYIFGGQGYATSNRIITLNDLWKWDGKQWIWLKGDKSDDGLSHYGIQNVPNKLNTPPPKVNFYYWKDDQDNFWVYGGRKIGSHSPDDLWRWDGKDWTWMRGDTQSLSQPMYGVQGVEAHTNTPGSRDWGVQWAGKNGEFWLYGGWIDDSSSRGSSHDLWRLRPKPFSKMVITGNGRIIEEQDLTPEWSNNTDFGSLSISNIPIKRTFQIQNRGTKAFTLWEDPVVVNGGSQHFSVVKQPTTLQVEPGESVSFTIALDPGVIGMHNTMVLVNSKDRTEPYTFAITGMATAPNINLIDTVTCSTARLFIKQRNVDHYTVLVSDSGKTEFPIDNENYNYSPYFLQAPVVKEHARIMYQGSQNTLDINELISGRSYQLVVVPGNGGAGNTTYFKDSSSILYFRTPASKWQDSLQITPSGDSGVCETDTLIFQGSSPFAIRWNDGPTEDKRRLLASSEYYFLSLDSEHCWMGSDSVNLEKHALPIVDSIYVSTPKPWCEGDTLELVAIADHPAVWSTGEVGTTLLVTENGEYSMISTSFPGCSIQGSLSIQLNILPDAYFLTDVYNSYEEDITLDYTSNESEIIWVFAGDTFANESDIKIKADGEILLLATTSNGCKKIDTAQVIRREAVLRAIPDAFSPNDDGVNDVWFFLHENDSGVLTVFNRWGGVMYEGSPVWDGKIFEESVPSGIYFYHYRTEEDGTEELLSGNVHVIR